MNTKPSSPSSPLSEALSRRQFSKLLATSALGTLVAPAFLRGQNLNSKLKVAIQMGTQIHAGDNYRRVVELVQSGAIGPVREVHVWVGRAWGWQSPEAAEKNHDIVSVRGRPAETSPVPKGLD